MTRILIVEDELWTANGLSTIIKSIDSKIQVSITGYAKEALEYAKKDDYDAFLLDIQLKDYSGLVLGKEIREINQYKLTPIIFITAIPTRELLAFKEIHCYDYIVKPFQEEDVKSALETIIHYGIKENHQKENAQKESLQIKQKGYSYLIKQKEIKYIEVVYRKILLVTINEETSLSGYTLGELLDELNPNFIQCHRGYIINIDYIKKINKASNEIFLQGIETAIPIGRTYIENLRSMQLWD